MARHAGHALSLSDTTDINHNSSVCTRCEVVALARLLRKDTAGYLGTVQDVELKFYHD